jgi:hypothetical protein
MYKEDVYIYIYIVILSCDSVLTLSGRGEPPHKGRRLSRDYVLHVPMHSQHLCGVAFDMVSCTRGGPAMRWLHALAGAP